MRRPAQLPEPLRGRGFGIDEARALGVTEGRLRGRDLTRPFYAVRASAQPESVADAVATYASRLRPGDRFSHTTAAALWDVPLPIVRDGIHVTSRAPRNAPRGRGVTGHEDEGRSVIRHGWPVSSPGRTFIELATELELADLVAAGDALVLEPPRLDPRDPRPHIELTKLGARVAEFRGRGARLARHAMEFVRLGAESRPESLLRVAIVEAGLPEPLVNPEIRDCAGRWLGRVDLAYPDRRLAIEYDGGHHRTPAQFEADWARLERFHLAGWRTIHVRSRGLFVERAATLGRIRGALGALGANLPT